MIRRKKNQIKCMLFISSNDKGGEGGVHFYDWLPTENEPFHFAVKNYKSIVAGYYVTVTSLMEDHIQNQKILEVSSWGKKYYVNYDEFIDYVEKHSNFMWSNINYIKK